MGIRLWRRLRSDEAFGLVELMIALLILNTAVLALVAAFVSSSTTLRRASRTANAATLADRQLELYRALTFSVIALDSTAVGSTDTTYRNDTALPSNSTTNLITATCSALPITGATNAGPIVITTSTAHGWNTGDNIAISGVGGNTAANGAWPITVLSSTTFSLNGSTGNGSYTSGGTAIPTRCNPSRLQAGPDGESYRVDTYVVCVNNTTHAVQTPSTCDSSLANGTVKLVTVAVRDANDLAAKAWARQSSSFDRSTGS